jgi:ubiquinone/menaquinone biosynthesis C-methylase UbiE
MKDQTINQAKKRSDMEIRVHEYRAQWSFDRLAQMVQKGSRILNLGAGDCRLDRILARDLQCDVVSLDVDDYNETNLPLLLYNGLQIPFPDDSFDVVLLLFALHHAEQPTEVLREAHRVCRKQVIVFEDKIVSPYDKMIFRGFHHFLTWSQGFSFPQREWTPEQWSLLAKDVGFVEVREKDIGRTFSYLASRHIALVCEKKKTLVSNLNIGV